MKDCACCLLVSTFTLGYFGSSYTRGFFDCANRWNSSPAGSILYTLGIKLFPQIIFRPRDKQLGKIASAPEPFDTGYRFFFLKLQV